MVYGIEPNTEQNTDGVVWDFRQVYVDWINYHIKDFVLSWRSRDYSLMLEKLRDWHSAIWGRTLSREFIESSNDKYFNELVGRIIYLSNEHKKTYVMKDRNPVGVEKLNEAFRVVVSYLVFLMKKNKMFGTESVNRGL